MGIPLLDREPSLQIDDELLASGPHLSPVLQRSGMKRSINKNRSNKATNTTREKCPQEFA